MTPDIYLLLLEYGQAHEPPAIELLASTLRRGFPGRVLRTLIVDNALAGESHTAIDGHSERISGDNSLREFSGWDRGLAWLERRYAPAPDSIVVLANDTVARPDKSERVRRLSVQCGISAVHGALVGWVDEYPRPVELFGMQVRQWVDTSLVITSRRTLKTLEPLAVPLDDDQIFDDDWRRVFREPSPLSANYRTYLRTYFLGDCQDEEFAHSWYAQAPVTPDNFDELKTKLRCVFCEHLLSARARALGIPLADIRTQPLPIDRFPIEVESGD